MIKTKFLLFLIFLTFSAEVFGQLEGNPENWCRNGFFPRESANYKIAKIKGKKNERIYFYADDGKCPNDKNCIQKSYLVPNDEVIISRTFGNYGCGWFQPEKGSETVGWIELSKLTFAESSPEISIEDWLGEWRFSTSSITISKTKKAKFVKVTGEAFWKGLGDNIHSGVLDYIISAPQNTILKIDEDETEKYACKVTMHRVGKYLIVSDNLNCGGANVSFSGVFKRKIKK